MPQVDNVAPRVSLYRHGEVPPAVEPGWITLAQLPQAPDSPAVFGDGSHPTTRLCAAAVDLLCRQRQPEAVLDVGTGTGVLARIARARGAKFVAGTDIDPSALACARSHVLLDAHPVEIELSGAAPDHWDQRFDLIVANILEAPLQSLAAALWRAVRPGGVLLISGFMRAQAPALRVAYEKVGFTTCGPANLDDWVLLRFVKGRPADESPSQ